jgi:hypothetical protein
MNKMGQAGLVALMLVGLGVSAQAFNTDGIRLTPLVGFRVGGELEDAETGAKYSLGEAPQYGVSLAVPFDRRTFVELIYSYSEADFDLGSGTEVNFGSQYVHIGWLQYLQAEKLVPYFSPGIGWTHFFSDDGSVSSSDRFSLGFGFGADYLFTDHIGLRAGGRLYGTFTSSDSRAVYGSRYGTVYSGSMMFQTDFSLGLVIVF